MIFISICAYKLITIKAYEMYWSKKVILTSIILLILFIINFIYNLIKDKDKIENMFINIAIPIGVLFIMFMLPTYTPDACSHIWRSYEISTGTFITKVDDNGESKTTVPEILSTYNETKLIKYRDLNEVLSLKDVNDYSKTVKMDSPSKEYSFVFFIGYAIGFLIARILNLNIIIAIFLAKLINFIIVLYLGYLSIKLIPFGKLLMFAYLTIPMMMHQFTAVTADCIMNSIIILFISYTINLSFKKEPLTRKEIVIFLGMTIFIGLSKITYIPILGIGVILAIHRKELTKKQKIMLGIVALMICVMSLAILNIINRNYTNETAQKYLETEGVNSSEQLKGMISNPLKLVKVLTKDLLVNGDFYLFNTIGDYMGWLSIKAPNFLIVAYILLIFSSIFLEENKVALSKGEKIWMIILFVCMVVLIQIGLYIEWTGVGADVVAGVQGRYFLPILILPLLACCLKENYIKLKNPILIVSIFSLLINGAFILNMINFFI